ncbi:MAG TPA: glycoside hydrolase family 13 protein [Cyclobacteriaceae bacterium]|nr:glycoside hydrolase family 13 protein [Cyclobacteriaceae bacterium]
MKKLLLLPFLIICFQLVAQSTIQRVEPPSWWAGMNHHTLQLLVQGENIGTTKVNINYPGVQITKVNEADNKNFLFIDLALNEDVKPGRFNIEFTTIKKKKITYSYELKQRDDGVKGQGLTQNDIIYLITPDRFVNANPANDDAATMKEKKNRGFHGGRHGGDLEGIISKIDYMNDLGVTAVWSSPVAENNMTEYSYHGYAITDYYNVDPRFGNNELYKKLGTELHKKNMKLVMDMVFNHCGVEHWWMKDMPYADWIHYYPKFIETNHAKASLSDTHGTQADREQMEKGWFVPTMPDLNHDNRFMATYLIQNSVWWIEYAGLDGIRMDTYPYNKKEFMAEWANYVYAEYPKFYMVGESWVNTTAQEAYWSDKGKKSDDFNSHITMTDFPLCFALHSAFRKDGDIGKLYDIISEDFLYTNANNNKIFGDNHDMDRLFYIVGQDMSKFKIALTFILTTRGIPQLYYGTEIAMKGNDKHGIIREDFPGGWTNDKRNAFTAEGRTTQENEVFNHIQKLLKWRKSSDAIQHGSLKHFVPYNNLYVYNQKSEKESIVVMINNSIESKKIDTSRYEEFLKGYDGATDLLTGKKISNLHEIDMEGNSSLVLELIPSPKAAR